MNAREHAFRGLKEEGTRPYNVDLRAQAGNADPEAVARPKTLCHLLFGLISLGPIALASSRADSEMWGLRPSDSSGPEWHVHLS